VCVCGNRAEWKILVYHVYYVFITGIHTNYMQLSP